jgi:DNA-binding NtrC family response regulator
MDSDLRAKPVPEAARPRILVAEDDSDCAQAVQVMLRSAHDVYVAESGRDLLRVAMSAYSRRGDACPCGFTGLLHEPFGVRHLLGDVGRALH